MSDALKVLIVEDEALLQMQLAMLLEDTGHVVAAAAATAREAEAAIARQKFDLALVDIHLGDGPSGLGVGRKLAEAGIPYMFVTANAGRIPDDFCGGWGVISKPYSAGIMERAVGYLSDAVRNPPPRLPAPSGMELAPRFQNALD